MSDDQAYSNPATIEAGADAVRRRWAVVPRVGVILGTGLGGLAELIDHKTTIPYDQIPSFPASTAIGHKGQLVCGRLKDVPIVAMQGRFHLYEGYSAGAVAFPVRVMRALGTSVLIVSNASGGLNPQYRSGDIMLIDDHINLMFANPLVGPNDDRLGDRFPDMSSPYDRRFGDKILEIARRKDYGVHRGVYAALSGPTYETRAEYRMLRRLGADVVGMSTVPEVIAALHSRMRVVGLSVVTNLCRPDALAPTHGEEVVAIAAAAASRLEILVSEFVSSCLSTHEGSQA